MKTSTKQKTLQMVQVAFMATLVVVLQLLSTLTAGLLPVNITLTLMPIVIGGILLGPAYGAALGLIFGLIVLIFCAAGMDLAGAILFNANPFLCSLLCLLKGGVAGFAPAFLFNKTKEFVKKSPKHDFTVTMIGAAICPILNTGIFCLGMVLFFEDVLIEWAGGTNVITYMLLSLAGINFLIEFFINVILCPIVVSSLRKTKYFNNAL
ncbi:MAG: energy-coupled thiamine transporter ThiT [Clostridia bacterium]|nr:energy-coupled thiamine transporter ThiT [Clostridia bacterium]